MAAPFLEFRTTDVTHALVPYVQLTGTGTGGAVTLGSTSTPQSLRVYNNYSAAGGIGTAYNLTFASYDDPTTWAEATIEPVTGSWLQVKVLDYDGSTTSADTQWYPLGGLAKHVSPVNSGQIAGNTAHYVTFSLQVSIPFSTSTSYVSQGLWIEYTWV